MQVSDPALSQAKATATDRALRPADVNALNYRQLQATAKKLGLKANASAAHLRTALLERITTIEQTTSEARAEEASHGTRLVATVNDAGEAPDGSEALRASAEPAKVNSPDGSEALRASAEPVKVTSGDRMAATNDDREHSDGTEARAAETDGSAVSSADAEPSKPTTLSAQVDRLIIGFHEAALREAVAAKLCTLDPATLDAVDCEAFARGLVMAAAYGLGEELHKRAVGALRCVGAASPGAIADAASLLLVHHRFQRASECWSNFVQILRECRVSSTICDTLAHLLAHSDLGVREGSLSLMHELDPPSVSMHVAAIIDLLVDLTTYREGRGYRIREVINVDDMTTTTIVDLLSQISPATLAPQIISILQFQHRESNLLYRIYSPASGKVAALLSLFNSLQLPILTSHIEAMLAETLVCAEIVWFLDKLCPRGACPGGSSLVFEPHAASLFALLTHEVVDMRDAAATLLERHGFNAHPALRTFIGACVPLLLDDDCSAAARRLLQRSPHALPVSDLRPLLQCKLDVSFVEEMVFRSVESYQGAAALKSHVDLLVPLLRTGSRRSPSSRIKSVFCELKAATLAPHTACFAQLLDDEGWPELAAHAETFVKLLQRERW